MRMRLIAVGAILVAVTSLGFVANADAHYRIKGKSHPCRYVSFQPGTDWGASAIRAKGVRCRLARQVARNWEGWSCEYQVRQQGDRWSGIAHTDYRCRDWQHPRRRVIVFIRT